MVSRLRTRFLALGFTALILAAGCADPITSPRALSEVASSIVSSIPSTGEISAGGYHTCGLRTDGTVACWGRNISGESTPPSGLIASQVDGGTFHACAIRLDGSVACWGDNSWGQRNAPPGLVATHISAGSYNTCAVRLDTTVACWGDNQHGISTPPAGLTSVAEIMASLEHTCALRIDGTVVCWGNFYDAGTPPGLLATQISGIWNYVCALRDDETLTCWGYPPYSGVVPTGIVVDQVAAGGGQTCALNTDATVSCWGLNDFGQATVPTALSSVGQVSAGREHTCALRTDGTVACWGSAQFGQAQVPVGLNLIATQPQAITITSVPPAPAFVGASYEVTANGGDSGNPVTFSSLTATTCGVSGSTVDFLAVGTCTIAADQSGSEGYDPAPQVTQDVSVVEMPVVPVVSSIALPVSPMPISTAIEMLAAFTDGNALDTHTASASWGDGASTAGSVSETNGAGTVSDSHAYAEAGVYTVSVAVSDGSLVGTRSSAEDVPAFVVVYDPSAGFVTGGGWITSPVGAYAANPALTGKASFGFVSRYKRGATSPSGNTQFQFHTAGFEFSSTSYQWLVVAGAKALYKGTGLINGGGNYGFMLSAVDGQTTGGGGTDRFRIRIWDFATGAVIYDNEVGAPDDADATTALGGGSIVIHR
jgi:hypothetical protein